MDNLTHLAEAWQSLLHQQATELARSTGYRVRQSKLNGPALLASVVWGWWSNPHASRSELARRVGVSKQALDHSLDHKAARFLAAILGRCVAQALECPTDPPATSVSDGWRGGRIFLVDSTVISLPNSLAQIWPGCGQAGSASEAGVKLHLGYDLASGAWHGPYLTPARTHDRAGPVGVNELPSGSVVVRDLGYYKLSELRQYGQSGLKYVSRVLAHTQIYDQRGRKLSLADYLAGQKGEELDEWVEVGVKPRLNTRLVARRLSGVEVSQRQAGFKELARHRQRKLSTAQVECSYWRVYVTNLKAEEAGLAEIEMLYRLRWQIELVFKLWKSGGGRIEEWHSQKPWAIVCEIYAKLIGVVLEHQLMVAGLWDEPERSMVKARRVIGQYVEELGRSVGEVSRMVRIVVQLRRALGIGCILERGSRRRPSSYQRLVAIGWSP